MVGKCQGVAVGVGVVSGSEWDNCKERNVDVGDFVTARQRGPGTIL
jgi:hypothetical protein